VQYTEDAPWSSLLGSVAIAAAPVATAWQSISGAALTTLIQSWISGTKTNNGLILGANFGYWGYYWTVSDVQLVLTWTTVTPVIPVITTEPKDTIVLLGNPASMTVVASGTAPLTYAWYKTSVATANLIASQTSATFTIAGAQMTDTGVYRCVVKNASGADTSRAAHVAVTGGKPVITVEPKDTAILERSALSLPVVVTGTSPFTYAWYKGSLVAANKIATQTAASLSFASVQLSDSGKYQCIVNNAAGADTSRAAHVVVQSGSPVITVEPHDTGVFANSAFKFTVTASGVAPLAYKWYKNGVAAANLITGQTTNILSFPSAQTSDSGSSFACVVSNAYGADTSLAAHLTVAPNVSISNPIVIHGVFQDTTHVRLTISRYMGLPQTAPLLFPWRCDTVFVWYKANGWPANPPPRGDVNQLAFSLRQLQTKSSDQYDTLVTVVKNASPTPCYRYCFLGSANWKNSGAVKDSMPLFQDTLSTGASIVMCDTTPLINPIGFSFLYAKGSDSVTVTLSNLSQLTPADWARVASVSVSYAIAGGGAFTDVLPVAALSGVNTFTKVYKDPRFAADQKMAEWQAVINGLYGSRSAAAADSCLIGFVRPVNSVILTADTASTKATQIRLTWTRNTTPVDSVRIWYGLSQVSLTSIDMPTSDFSLIGPLVAADTSVWVTGLTDSTQYYFGLQVEQGGFWSYVTIGSRIPAMTHALVDTSPVANKLTLLAVAFDSVLNRLAFTWQVDTTGLQLEAGIVWRQDQAAFTVPNPPSAGSIVAVTALTPTTYYVNVNPPVLNFGASYRFGIWLRKVDGKWSAPTAASETTYVVPLPAWQKVTIFPSNANVVSAFGGAVVLQKDTVRGSQFYDNEATLRKTTLPFSASGCIPVSMAVTFDQQNLPPIPYLVGLHYDPLPARFTTGDVRMYHFDTAAGTWLVDTAPPVIDEANGIISVEVLGSQCRLPFVLMIDTVKPVVGVLSDTGSVLTPGQDISVKWCFGDNIANVKTTLSWGRADEALFHKDTIVSACADTVTWVIPGSQYLVIEDFGVRVLLTVSDGHYDTTINVSRDVQRAKSNAFTPAHDQWVPVATTSVLDSPQVAKALAGLADTGKQWKYDNTKFRIFKWAGSAWEEYSDAQQDQFSFQPCRVNWLKATTTAPMDLGSGRTVSLKSPCTVVVHSGSWNDVCVPFQFPIRIGDILLSTVVSGSLQASEENSLEIYQWLSSPSVANGRYYPDAIYLPGVPGKMDLTTTLSYRQGQGLAYSIFSNLGRDITLLIPPTPEVLSQVPSAKQAHRDEWSVVVRPGTADGLLSPVFCGYVQGGTGTVGYPMPPSWSKVSVGVLDDASNRVFGNQITHELHNGGFSFKLAFENDQDAKELVKYSVEPVVALGKDVRAVVIDATSGSTAVASGQLSISLEKNSRGYRWLAIGTQEYIRNFSLKILGNGFGIVRVGPNPFRNSLRIVYTVPKTGVDRIRFECFDQRGRVVWSSVSSALNAGENQIVWDPKDGRGRGRGLAAGIYILRLTGFNGTGKTGNVRQTRVTYLP
jgi:hypothetical protein